MTGFNLNIWYVYSSFCKGLNCDKWIGRASNIARTKRLGGAGICFYQLRQLRIIRRSLTTDAAHSLVRALIHTRVDYCNGLLAAGPKYLLQKLQSVLRAAVRLVLQSADCSSRIVRPFLTLCNGSCTGSRWQIASGLNCVRWYTDYRCLHGLAPHYLSDLCTPAMVHGQLRSSVTLDRSLSIPRTKTRTLSPRVFYFASTAAWNALPVHLRDPDLSLNSFKTKLKTHFFIFSSGSHPSCYLCSSCAPTW